MKINLPVLLDVAIGLIFIFFVLSVFVSGIVEFINTFIEQRARLLRIALDKLLGEQLATAFFAHKLTAVKRQRFWGFMKPVSYLSADSFSTVLIDLLVKAGRLAEEQGNVDRSLSAQSFAAIQQGLKQESVSEVRELIEPILAKSDDFHAFKAQLEQWYNGYMEQVSGWFKRYAQGVVWLVSIAITVLLNIDSIHLVNRLFNDDGLRERVIAQAIRTAENGSDTLKKNEPGFIEFLHKQHSPVLDSTKTIKTNLSASDKLLLQTAYVTFVSNKFDALQLPVGWIDDKSGWQLQPDQSGWSAVGGWILTIAALSFGAPFWFDLLLKLVNIRNTARRPSGNPTLSK